MERRPFTKEEFNNVRVMAGAVPAVELQMGRALATIDELVEALRPFVDKWERVGTWFVSDVRKNSDFKEAAELVEKYGGGE